MAGWPPARPNASRTFSGFSTSRAVNIRKGPPGPGNIPAPAKQNGDAGFGGPFWWSLPTGSLGTGVTGNHYRLRPYHNISLTPSRRFGLGPSNVRISSAWPPWITRYMRPIRQAADSCCHATQAIGRSMTREPPSRRKGNASRRVDNACSARYRPTPRVSFAQTRRLMTRWRADSVSETAYPPHDETEPS